MSYSDDELGTLLRLLTTPPARVTEGAILAVDHLEILPFADEGHDPTSADHPPQDAGVTEPPAWSHHDEADDLLADHGSGSADLDDLPGTHDSADGPDHAGPDHNGS